MLRPDRRCFGRGGIVHGMIRYRTKRRGSGKKLVNDVLRWAKSLGFQRIAAALNSECRIVGGDRIGVPGSAIRAVNRA